ncbi:secreted RxLR effector protein 161-like [Jatropha curcas]|uniref:secreted RxLR effector protein 161-like n=1 Tax=Jatropha curcas TaxID=180498 RepID=UPI0018956C67|nr:secreted RxLR effector protein 161-like [Jatropha curcas]
MCCYQTLNRPDICFAVGMVSRFQSNPGREHWTAVKHIIKYLKRTRDYRLVYQSDDLVPIGYTDSDFQTDKDSRKSTSGNAFVLGGGAISWRSIKQTCVADSTMEVEYVAASEAAKEACKLTEAASEVRVRGIVVDSHLRARGVNDFEALLHRNLVRDVLEVKREVYTMKDENRRLMGKLNGMDGVVRHMKQLNWMGDVVMNING